MASGDKKTVIVTAAGRGIGAACARMLAGKGWVPVLSSPSTSCETLAKELGGWAVRGSVTAPGDLEALVRLALDKTGRIDGVVANTGHGPGGMKNATGPIMGPDAQGRLLDIEDGDWHAGLDMYLLYLVRLLRLVTPVMERQGGGSIVAISSVNALEPRPRYPMSIIRMAMHGFTKLYADRYGRAGIRINNVLPGFVDNLQVPEEAIQLIPLKRPVKTQEIAATVAFLLSPEASGITAQNMLVDGGFTRAVR
ncbi:MAG: SDR family oxidoreductase [Alphaproteobacteria bacterium]|nr:SDR family oxidoreductase [Alphaproteobacteria bacterium]